jgi:hypothetical protein
LRRRKHRTHDYVYQWYFWFLGGLFAFALGLLTDAYLVYRDIDAGCRGQGYAWINGWSVICVDLNQPEKPSETAHHL